MRRALLFALAALSLSGCQGKLFSIHVRDSSTTVVKGRTIFEEFIDVFGFGDFLDMDIMSSEELQNQGVEPGDVQEVTLVGFSLAATSPDGADLSFLSDVELSVEGSGLPKVLLAEAHDFPEGEPHVDFELTGADITEYVVSRSMSLVVDVTGQRPEDDTEVEAAFDLKIGVTGQGIVHNTR